MSEARNTFLEWLRYDNTLEILSEKRKTKDNLHKDLRIKLVLKLSLLVKGKISQGVFNDLGEEVIQQGKKYSFKMLNDVDDYIHLTSGNWTTDSLINSNVSKLINKYRTFLKNYNITKSANKVNLKYNNLNKVINIIDFIDDRKTYLMKDNHTKLYKIGFSNNPKHRETTLQSEKPSIKMVKIWNKNIEKKLHKLYSEYRVRGEWFNLTPIQVKYICTQF